jgi:hypothetical protein
VTGHRTTDDTGSEEGDSERFAGAHISVHVRILPFVPGPDVHRFAIRT